MLCEKPTFKRFFNEPRFYGIEVAWEFGD